MEIGLQSRSFASELGRIKSRKAGFSQKPKKGSMV